MLNLPSTQIGRETAYAVLLLVDFLMRFYVSVGLGLECPPLTTME